MTEADGVTQHLTLVVPPHAIPTTTVAPPSGPGGVVGTLPRTGAGPLLCWLIVLGLVLVALGSLLVHEARARRS